MPWPVQWLLAIAGVCAALIAPLALVGVGIWGVREGNKPLATAAWILLLATGPLIFSALIFTSTPVFTLLGWYRYRSPSLLCFESPGAKALELHTGTSFDWVVLVHRHGIGPPLRRAMVSGALDGLLALIDEVEGGAQPTEREVVGESWFFSERTARRLGFEVGESTANGRSVFLVAFHELLVMASLTAGQVRVPRVSQVKRARTTLGELRRHRPRIEALRRRLERASLSQGLPPTPS